ncbi:hypothetical protein Patl1_13384 [Pistacia atlantica]|uniref:Uncharacterized protein n=1 Tax=Pistacia atlantica TaxID=434234 RepID=A0ACC1AV37_9ROSI|nr:hypothetical protein Patl1_13384 [Pistacia atlantica]
MEKSCVLAFLLLHLIFTEAGFGVGGGVGIGIGNAGAGGGGTGVWIGGTTPSGSSGSSDLNAAYTALQAWKSAITDDPLGILRTWVGSDVCSYKGVFCSETPVRVVSGIDLNHANLQGNLVNELSVLTDMTLLHLNSNRFSGTIPDTLKGPHFSPRVRHQFNSFSGTLPEDLFTKGLDAIFVNNNQFTGELPQNLPNSPASVINLANNKFTGSIPVRFAFSNSKLKEILLLNNQLTGCIPQGVGLFSDLQVFDVSYNSLMGRLPDTISCLNAVEVLNLAHNELSGELPDLGLNVGFDFASNCIPGRDMQRPQPDCSTIPGGGLSCLRVPSVQPLVCGSLIGNSAHQSP